MSEYTGKIQIKENAKPHHKGYTVITDTETDGQLFYEEVLSYKNARRICQCVNSFDKLLEACREAVGLLCAEHRENQIDVNGQDTCLHDMGMARDKLEAAIAEAEKGE